MKFKLNRAFREASGQLDGLVYRNVRGQVIASRKADLRNVVSSDSQIAHRERFKQAAAYGKSVMADADVRAQYEVVAKNKNMSVFALTIADFFNAPVIDTLDVTLYNGQAGDLITISARDDVGVVSVQVSITDEQLAPIESGNAVETAAGSGRWVYTTTTAIPADTNVLIKAVATDRPGGSAVKSQTKNF